MLPHVLEAVPSSNDGFQSACHVIEAGGFVFAQPWISPDQRLALLHVRTKGFALVQRVVVDVFAVRTIVRVFA